MSSSPTAEVSTGPRPAFTPGAAARGTGKGVELGADRPPRCERHAAAASGAQRDGRGRFAGDGVDDCTKCSSLSRSHRRRRSREQERELARRSKDPRQEALDRAQELKFLADKEPDDHMRRALYRLARRYEIRHSGDEHLQRKAVLGVLERNALSTIAEIMNKTLLPKALIKSFLDEWAGADVDLVFITTMDGKRKCGRKGTVLYYGLNK